jgi:hypothetical protein
MVRWRKKGLRGPAERRRRYPTLVTALSALVAQGCGATRNPDAKPAPSEVAGQAGQAGSGGATGGGGALSLGGSDTLNLAGQADVCADSLFAEQVVSEVGKQRVFYSWTTDEQVAELRAGGELFSRSERPGMGRGLLFTELATLAEASTPEGTLADVLGQQTFAKARFAWPNPWATLLGFPGESYGNQLLRIELKADAWIAYLDAGELSVVDAQNQPVSLEDALASPERIGAIYYQSAAQAGSAYCGSFSHGAVGFREFALGNIDMVARWSLATPEITARLEADLEVLRTFEERLVCLSLTTTPADWADQVGCTWGRDPRRDLLGDYDFALGLPSELYWPSPENIAALISAVEASLPTGDPLSVTPGQ